MDNWAGHIGENILGPLEFLCEQYGFKIKLLSKYSPELNPCKLIFGFVKEKLRNSRQTRPFWLEILKCLSLITYE